MYFYPREIRVMHHELRGTWGLKDTASRIMCITNIEKEDMIGSFSTLLYISCF